MRKKLPTILFYKIILIVIIFLGFVPKGAYSQSPQPGDIVITEYMPKPSSVKEYVELYNKRSVPFNIDGFKLKDDGSDSHTIDNGGTLTIPAESFIVISLDASDYFTVDYVYSGVSLNDSGDEIVLTNGNGTEIARVNYTGTSVEQGKADVLDDIQNVGSEGQADISNYRNSNDDISDSGDKGSPGAKGSSTPTVLDEDPTVRILKSSFTASEGSGSKAITVILEDPDGSAVDVDLARDTEESESESGDFEESSPVTLSFSSSANDGDSLFAYTPTEDTDHEGDEASTFYLTNLSTSGNATIAYADTTELTITDNDNPNVVLNEIYADPADDANGDGNTSTDSDEFVEIFNNESVNVDISSWEITDNNGVKHTFAEGTVLRANESIVVFDNSGTPSGSFGGSKVMVSDNDLSLSNSSETITLKDSDGDAIDSHNYSSSPTDQSMVRDPYGTGSFADHTAADSDDGSSSSPGMRIDGTNFTNTVTIDNDAGWRMLSVPVENMNLDELEDDVHIQAFDGNGTGSNENLYTGYDGSKFTAPADLTSYNFTSGKGFLLYAFNNTDNGSKHLPITIDPGSGSEPASPVSVSLHTSGDKWNLVGNPYSTAIDISNISNWISGGSLNSTTGQIWDQDSESYVLTTSNNNKVEKWQGFFIQNSSASTMDIPADAKTSGEEFFKNTDRSGYVALTLNGKDSDSDKMATDKASVLYFHSEATNQWDTHDASKLNPLTADYALLGIEGTKDGESILKAQDSRPYNFEGEITYDLEIQAKNINGEYNISWEKDNIPEQWNFTLIDNKTGEKIDMNMEHSYSFNYRAAKEKSTRKLNENAMTASLPDNISTVEPKQKGGGPRFTITASNPNGLQQNPSDLPRSASLNPNYPNPFNPTTTLSYELAEDANVTLTVWNMIGQRVSTLVDGMVEAGSHTQTWNASDMPSGIYIARFEVDGKVFTRKMTLIK